MLTLMLVAASLLFAGGRASAPGRSASAPAWTPPPPDAVHLEALLEKTIFQVDVIALDLWLGPASVAQVRRLGAPADEAAGDRTAAGDEAAADGAAADRTPADRTPTAAHHAPRDSLAAIVAGSRDAGARMVVQRDVSLDRFLDGVIADMRRAHRAGLLSAEGLQHVATGLPVWLAPLRTEGLREGDRFLYRIAGDTLRTRVERARGAVVIDQTDVGPEHRRALLGSLVAPGGGFAGQLLDQLARLAGPP